MGCFRTGGIVSEEAEKRVDGGRTRGGDVGRVTGRRSRCLGSSASSASSSASPPATDGGKGPGCHGKVLARAKKSRGGGGAAAAAACRRMVVGMRALNLIFSEARRSLSLTFRSRAVRTGNGDEGKGRARAGRRDSENNRSWLLADAREEQEDDAVGPAPFSSTPLAEEEAVAMADPHSVHSSFRFSFGSQPEVEPTVLMVSEDEQPAAALPSSSASRDHTLLIKWRRLESLERSISPVAGALLRFSYPEIRSATRDFHPGRVLGIGALSRVYRGKVAAGMGRRGASAVAVKRLQGEEKECAKAFCRELMVASGLRHPNVVPLLGFCVDPQGLFLVYKFVSGGSLDQHLHPEDGGEGEEEGRRPARRRRGRWVGSSGGLTWGLRWKVAIGAARAVEYLHQGTDRCVVHRDIKPSNILLSAKKNPKLCDFGLATWTHGPSLPFLCKTVKGTFGYLAPEYFQHGKLSDKTDIYAFGVLLLELITGRKPIDTSRPQGDENLVLWAKPLLQQGEAAIEELVDPRLKFSSYNQVEISRMVQTAAACLNSEEMRRPRIGQVIGMLHGTDENCDDWSVFTGGGCFAGFSQFPDPQAKSDMRDHLTLAMLGISDNEEDDIYGR